MLHSDGCHFEALKAQGEVVPIDGWVVEELQVYSTMLAKCFFFSEGMHFVFATENNWAMLCLLFLLCFMRETECGVYAYQPGRKYTGILYIDMETKRSLCVLKLETEWRYLSVFYTHRGFLICSGTIHAPQHESL